MYRTLAASSTAGRSVSSPAPPSIQVVAGATGSVRDSTGQTVVTLGSVPLGAGMTPPDGGLLMLYGFMSFRSIDVYRTWAAACGARLATATYDLDAGPVARSSTVTRSDLAGLGQVYVRQLAAPLQAELADHCTTLSRRAGSMSLRGDGSLSPIETLSERADLWSQLLDAHPDFRHLRVVIVPINDLPGDSLGKFRELAFVRPGTPYREVETDAQDVRLQLPQAYLSAQRFHVGSLH